MEAIEREISEWEELVAFAKSKSFSLVSSLEDSLKTVHAKKDKLVKKEEAERRKAEEKAASPAPSPPTSVPSASKATVQELSKFAWDQDSKKLSIYVNEGLEGIQEVPKENISCVFNDRSFALKVFGLRGNNYGLSKENLEKELNIAACKLVVKENKVRIILTKKEAGHWMDIVEKKKKMKEPKSNPDDPSAGLMDLMKNLYEEGDDDMKRTIAKAWTESKEKKDSLGSGKRSAEDLMGDDDM